jgi:hypothetical protein
MLIETLICMGVAGWLNKKLGFLEISACNVKKTTV